MEGRGEVGGTVSTPLAEAVASQRKNVKVSKKKTEKLIPPQEVKLARSANFPYLSKAHELKIPISNPWAVVS